MVNTALTPLDPSECAKPPTGKMAKALKGAYDIAAENHGLDYYKDLLKVWQEEEESIQRQQEALDAENARLAEEQAKEAEQDAKSEAAKEKPKKKAARKSKAADEDVDMEDAEPPKSSKKRKKDADSDAEGPQVSFSKHTASSSALLFTDTSQQKKTPKITKLNAPKTPNGEASTSVKKPAAKPKRKVVAAPKEAEEESESKPEISAEERLMNRERTVLYLRHRLQKGFLARDQAPKESEMPGMADFFSQLEAYQSLEPSIIRNTKIHKVLKAVIKLASVPKDDEYQFKKRSAALLEEWNKRMEAEGGAEPVSVEEPKSIEPETNGNATAAKPDVKPEDADAVPEQQDVEMKEADETKEGAAAETTADEPEEKGKEDETDGVEASDEKSAKPTVDSPTDAQDAADGDVSMQTAPEEATA